MMLICNWWSRPMNRRKGCMNTLKMFMRSLFGLIYFLFWSLLTNSANFPDDIKMINEIGHIGASHFLQVISTRLVSIGHTQEVSFEKEKKDAATIEKLTKFVNEKEQKVIELSSSLK
ncbi:uncharacterized protein LOC127742417 [Arachis duranensis]|uniref:Uncharacterized protein LOC127742417 n=1 Tax=Arachis duranensis TaxID=130453 RepID=A0A9C6WM15_ARADU|nr:uncharacterized protein LOC127742417 [Arachis duranensis]